MQLIEALSEIARGVDQPIIAIDGPAGAGKTTLASTISLALSPHISTTVIHMDQLYPGWEGALGDELTKTLTWVTTCHKAKRPLLFSSFNWASKEFDSPKSHPSTQLLILEGVASAQIAIEESLATSIWLDLYPADGYQRVIERDGENISHEMKQWLVTQEQHFAADRTKERCEFLLST
jgi:energy-coupling factor transporter ATP-binding protein EcfA2